MVPNDMAALSEEAIANQYPDVYNSLVPLFCAQPDSLDAYLETVACNVNIAKTQTPAHCSLGQTRRCSACLCSRTSGRAIWN